MSRLEWQNFGMRTPTSKDRIAAQLRGVSAARHIFDEWLEEVKRSGDNFEMLDWMVKHLMVEVLALAISSGVDSW